MPKQRGRKAGHTPLAVIDGTRGSKPAPPGVLNDFEAAVWQRIIGEHPPDWFGKDTEQNLIALCRNADTVARLDVEIGKIKKVKRFTDAHLKKLDRLTKMRDREARLMLSLCRSMRITQQSINPDRAATVKRKHGTEAKGAQPWES